MTKNIFITGGAGYVGSSLALFLLKKNYSITIYDNFFFGNPFKKNKNLYLIKGDIRDTNKLKEAMKNQDYLINLSSISNDQSFVKNEKIAEEINLHSFNKIIKIAKELGIKKFINTSSASVYGLSVSKNDEDTPPMPISKYSRINLINEKKTISYGDNNFTTTNIRPGSIFGLSPRMRFDLIINNYTISALIKKQIKIFGGFQIRPFISLNDLNRIYFKILNSKDTLINKETFNISINNHSLEYISGLIRSLVENTFKTNIEIKYIGTNDIRSYHMKSDKVCNILNFKYKTSIESSVIDILNFYKKLKNINYTNKIYINEKNIF